MNFLKIFLFLTSFLLASIPASAEAKNINFTSSETKPYFFYTAKKPRIAFNVNTTTSNNRSRSIELNLALSNSKATQKDKNDNTNKTPNGISNTSINYTNNKHNAKTLLLVLVLATILTSGAL
jgi:preprotein translocase subunit SecB